MHDTQRQINSIFVPGYSSSFYLHIDEKVLGLVAMLVPQIDEHKDKSTWLRMAAYKTRSKLYARYHGALYQLNFPNCEY